MANTSALRRGAVSFRHQIHTTKTALDETIVEMGKLLVCGGQVSLAAGLTVGESQATFLKLQRAISDGIKLRGTMMNLHVSARGVAAQHLQEFATGDTTDTPFDKPPMLAEAAPGELAAA